MPNTPGFWTSPVPNHRYSGFWTSPVPSHCYLQGFGHLQGQTTLHVDCTTNVHLGGAVHVVSYPDLIIQLAMLSRP